MRYWIEW